MDQGTGGGGHSKPPCGFCGRATVAIDFAAVPAGFFTCNVCLHDLAGVLGYRCPVCNFTIHREGCCPHHPPPQITPAGVYMPHQPPPPSHAQHHQQPPPPEAAQAIPPPQITGAGGVQTPYMHQQPPLQHQHQPPPPYMQHHQPPPPLALSYVHQEQPVSSPGALAAGGGE